MIQCNQTPNIKHQTFKDQFFYLYGIERQIKRYKKETSQRLNAEMLQV